MQVEDHDVDILFTGGEILTLDPARPYIQHGAVAITGKSVVAIGSVEEVRRKIRSAARTFDFSDLLMIPGLIDCHNHLFQTLGKTLGDGLTLLPWLSEFMLPLAANISSDEAIKAARMAALNCVLSGTTSVIDNHYAPVDEATTIGVATAIEEVGLRGVVARGIFGMMVDGGIKMNCDTRLFKYSNKDELEITQNCIAEKPKGSLVEIWPAPENVVYVDPELIIACHELATSADVSWHAHCSESKYEVEIFESIHGVRPAKWLNKEGILNSRTTLAHGIWFDDEEISLLGQCRANISHQPVCNQYLASGIVKLGPLMNAGANVALGTDGMAVAGQNMFEAMKSAQMLQHVRELDPTSSTSELVLCMATRNGGRMLKRNVGRIVEGSLADLVFVDMSGVHHRPASKKVCSLTLSTTASDVKHVVVNGQIVVEDGRSTCVDQEKIIADAMQAANDLICRAGLAKLVKHWNEPSVH
jgi:5-methylthioadenosine/S-adenosylhomocysteine deaminase